MVAELLIRRARIGARVADLRCGQGRIVEVGPGLARRPGDLEIDAADSEVMAGLVDHHVHLRALAAAGTSVEAGPPAVTDRRGLATALAAAAGRLGPGEWLRAVGYHESVAGLLDAPGLDALVDDRPVRLQHRNGSLWILNSAALLALDVARCPESGVERDERGQPTGRLWRMDRWLSPRVPRRPSDLGAVSKAFAAAGVTGFTDATPERSQDETDELVAACDDGVIAQRLCLMSPVGIVIPKPRSPLDRVELGPVKILLDDVSLPSLDRLALQVRAARAGGRAVAVHCVTRVQLVLTLAALEVAGVQSGDRIEHGALISPDQFAALRSLGVVVVTQPGLVATRGDDYRQSVEPDELPDLWRLGSLRQAGIPVALGTDAPYGPADPWVTLRAAQDRTTPSGAVLGAAERVGREEAVRLMTGPPGRPGRRAVLGSGQPADLCVRRDGKVTHTVVAGAVVFSA